ncbi:MAG: hypothetical protein ALECFALPRED_009703 [Alectoria fallacina]|uniref:Uncharacterized protein n=1 Tax=Alectoria fallacina TaxID=1903189 RepID=A0A8H3J8E1_9LECA|nr:MAG: hypothetical protein ALECFALPRED_009703 [Alectoria fallacina]
MKLPPGLSLFMLASFTASTPTTRIRQISNNYHSLDFIQAPESIHCQPLPGRISLHACAGAILRLPIDHTIGIFHSDGAGDGIKLPVSRTYNDCNVLVEMRGDTTDQDMGSWLDLGVAAAEMNRQCTRNIVSYRRYGSAWMNTGELDRIRIRLRPAEGSREVHGNGTRKNEKEWVHMRSDQAKSIREKPKGMSGKVEQRFGTDFMLCREA